ncbi:hypothetical protein PCASD_01623 [Puccinia coronata f. sp. avenae]|uniref:Uncharacterized protein n=1 Tax=Puccinia coronata f. sp. avenae TaxID=200324 RepID=A0A2N5VIL4_9BASI|nr:hypothetical protein PCASD_01623 [Puccinia coronata f. sp. avenae]
MSACAGSGRSTTGSSSSTRSSGGLSVQSPAQAQGAQQSAERARQRLAAAGSAVIGTRAKQRSAARAQQQSAAVGSAIERAEQWVAEALSSWQSGLGSGWQRQAQQ